MFNCLIFSFVCSFLGIYSAHSALPNDLLKELDAKLAKREFYMKIKEQRIDSLKKQLTPRTSLNDRYRINNDIYREYSTYRYDSAMCYISRNRRIADQVKVRKYADQVKLHTASLLSTAGLFNEAMDLLGDIDRGTLDPSLLLDYYLTCEWTYGRNCNYTGDDIYSPVYGKLESSYMDSVFMCLPPGATDHDYYRGFMLMRDGHPEEAEKTLLELLARLSVNTRLYAIVTANLATIYRNRGDIENYETYLMRSAISDQECALKENRSMQELAAWMFTTHPEELERANRYIQYAMEDAQFFNNRVRTIQIARTLLVIVSALQKKSRAENRNLKIALLIISFLSVGLLLSIRRNRRQMGMLVQGRQKLHHLNAELIRSNDLLTEANKTREVYVSLFIGLCSSYIEKITRYRNTVKRKIVANQIDDLYKLSNSPRHENTELSQFFDNFDTAFLNIYPGFIDEFNQLLTPERRIVLRSGEKLSPELRVFALVRLGITDSSRIASFLRLSPQTVYNYRAKVKRGSVVDRSEFEKHVMCIGVTA
jgi:DNA-binding CsgD family transcriptional regulator